MKINIQLELDVNTENKEKVLEMIKNELGNEIYNKLIELEENGEIKLSSEIKPLTTTLRWGCWKDPVPGCGWIWDF